VASGAKGPRAGQPKRRAFSAAYKLKIVEQYEQLANPRERGALLRREGLYHSHVPRGAASPSITSPSNRWVRRFRGCPESRRTSVAARVFIRLRSRSHHGVRH